MSINYVNLLADLSARGYTSASNPVTVAAAMNALTQVIQGDTTVGPMLQYLASVNLLIPFQTAAAKSGGTNQNNVQALYTIVQAGPAAPFQTSLAYVQSLLQSCVTAGQLTSTQQTTILALGNQTVSYVQQTYGVPSLTPTDVIVAFGGSAVILTPPAVA